MSEEALTTTFVFEQNCELQFDVRSGKKMLNGHKIPSNTDIPGHITDASAIAAWLKAQFPYAFRQPDDSVAAKSTGVWLDPDQVIALRQILSRGVVTREEGRRLIEAVGLPGPAPDWLTRKD